MDKLHLLEDGRLARLASPQEQHLDLVLGHHPVALQLALDLVVACQVVHQSAASLPPQVQVLE
jgi:hypothetical protein